MRPALSIAVRIGVEPEVVVLYRLSYQALRALPHAHQALADAGAGAPAPATGAAAAPGADLARDAEGRLSGRAAFVGEAAFRQICRGQRAGFRLYFSAAAGAD